LTDLVFLASLTSQEFSHLKNLNADLPDLKDSQLLKSNPSLLKSIVIFEEIINKL
jgi:hypothetical protein